MESVTTETLGQRLARLRAAANQTQEELANNAGVAPTSLRNWEQDHRRPRADAALRVARVLGVTVEELLVLPSSRPARSDVQDPPGVRALKRAWARANEEEQRTFLKFVEENSAQSRAMKKGKSDKKGESARSTKNQSDRR